MPNYTIEDIMNNPENIHKLTGYVGKILRLNLTEQTTELISTYQYVPKYLGGRELCNKIFWDEVKPGTGAFDPGNKLIYMTGATTGTGIPTGGRTEMTGISAISLPEQYSFSGIGGWMGAELKFAGYDGFIIEGRAEEPVYIVIDDDKVEFKSARNLWGKKVHDTQHELERIHGKQFKSMVIGPAGEHLVRNASITTSNDNVMAKSGFGAVWGSKNLKAITCHGTGIVPVADVDKILDLRMRMGDPFMRPSPVIEQDAQGLPGNEAKGHWVRGNVACSHGCNQHCNCLMMDTDSMFSDEKINHIEKCVSIFAYGFMSDVPNNMIANWMTKSNHIAPCKMLSREFPEPDPTDPYFESLYAPIMGDNLNFWKPDFEKGNMINELCNEYGMDKWDVIVWLLPWLSMGQKEGVFDEIDFGMPIDVESKDFVAYILDAIVFRKGYYGNLLAEGMARAIRKLGKEKFGDTIYHGRRSGMLPGNPQLDLPISMETAWGHSFHWQGRGFEASITKETWLATTIELMTSSRDMQTIEHHHDTYENYLEIKKDPYHSQTLVDSIIMNENKGELKDGVTCCDWQSPNLWWTSMEAEMYQAATGHPMTEEELEESANRSKLLYRAILIRNFGRDREMEVNAVWPGICIPDSWGEVADWEGFNDLVDMYYDTRGWDKKTAWPYRETWEKYGLKDIADEMEQTGKLPVK